LVIWFSFFFFFSSPQGSLQTLFSFLAVLSRYVGACHLYVAIVMHVGDVVSYPLMHTIRCESTSGKDGSNMLCKLWNIRVLGLGRTGQCPLCEKCHFLSSQRSQLCLSNQGQRQPAQKMFDELESNLSATGL
jgi:hypothetical protein